jgi:Fe2+ transport system protein B
LEQDKNFYGISESLITNLDQPNKNYIKSADELTLSLSNSGNIDQSLDISSVRKNLIETLSATEVLWQNSITELNKLLEIRIDSYKKDRTITLIIALSFVIFAYFSQFIVAKNISRLIQGVILFLNQTAKGEIDNAQETLSYLKKYYL